MQTTILIVEDNPATRKLFRVTLEGAGYSVVEAATADQALEAARTCAPSLVILDIIVPDARGFKLAQELLHLPEMKGVPVIAVSGSGAAVDAAKLPYIGFSDHLEKPVAPAFLLEKVKEHLP